MIHPYRFKEIFWPQLTFYDKQWEIVESVMNNDETTVIAGNKLGKDFIAGFIVLWFFLSRTPCRIITTSVKDDHLIVLWGEINRYIRDAKYPLTADKGGPLIVNHRKLRKIVNGEEDPISYVEGKVSSSIEGLQGHHASKSVVDTATVDLPDYDFSQNIPLTLALGDEASGLDDEVKRAVDSWAERLLWIGNPWPCENFFKHAVHGRAGTDDHGGDIPRDSGIGFHRKVVQISAEDSPNVKLGMAQERAGLEPDNRRIVAGVKTYGEYQKNLKLWDEVEKTVKLFGRFYEGDDIKLYPRDWIHRAWKIKRNPILTRRTMGVDTAQGGDDSVWTIIDESAILHMEALKTPNTSEIVSITKYLIKEWGIAPEDVAFDSGGGGREHADRLRADGYRVRAIHFGESVKDDSRFKRRLKTELERIDVEEERYVFKNRRAQMYFELRQALNEHTNPEGFGIPSKYKALYHQMIVIPLSYDQEGRMFVIPKDKPTESYTGDTLKKLLGRSPDHLDSLVLALHAMNHRARGGQAGVMAA